jgi:tryptophan-rich sensory protein
MVTTFTIPNVAIRSVLLAIGAAIAAWIAWRNTPELDSVDHRHFYRYCVFMLFLRVWCFLWFTVGNLFPLAGK